MGRAVASLLDDAELARLEARIAAADPVGWEILAERFRAGVARCRAHGFCTSAGDLLPDVHGAAAPLYRASNGDYLALNCSVPAFRLRGGEMDGEIGPRLLALARTLRTLMEQSA